MAKFTWNKLLNRNRLRDYKGIKKICGFQRRV